MAVANLTTGFPLMPFAVKSQDHGDPSPQREARTSCHLCVAPLLRLLLRGRFEFLHDPDEGDRYQ